MIKLYRKKPVVIQAAQFDGTWAMGDRILEWIDEHGGEAMLDHTARAIVISTLEGDMRAVEGDFVIKGVKGEFYPCKPDIFEATYEETSG